MCNISNTLQFSTLFWTLSSSLIPGHIFPYFVLGVTSVSFVIYTLQHNLPSARVNRLNNTIAVVEEILTQAKANCTRDYLALVSAETRFLRNCLSNMTTISRSLATVEREVRDIQTSLLLLIESVHQRKLAEDLHESQEIVDAVLPQQSCRARVYGRPTEPGDEV
ncbi:hypothetical protein DFH08DRAFT_808531 [Mycena albidolilacea]|uniref:Uncharacterized protein n=1 Tax=Mycena albidolilacea TaxID=1033008 RepID=A0AAD7EQV3_9AGAR|nr:hypothetical protein DFH08DRAFT_808531 [Mycena albidolilacea]